MFFNFFNFLGPFPSPWGFCPSFSNSPSSAAYPHILFPNVDLFFSLPSSGYSPPDDRHYQLQTGVINLRPVALTWPTFFTTPSTSPPPSPLHHKAVQPTLHCHPYTLTSTPHTLKCWAMAGPLLLRGIVVQEQDPLSDLPAALFLQNILQLH